MFGVCVSIAALGADVYEQVDAKRFVNWKCPEIKPIGPKSHDDGIPRIVNIIVTLRSNWPFSAHPEELLDTAGLQLAEVDKNALPCTVVMSWDSLARPDYLALVKAHAARRPTAVGVWYEIEKGTCDAVGLGWKAQKPS